MSNTTTKRLPLLGFALVLAGGCAEGPDKISVAESSLIRATARTHADQRQGFEQALGQVSTLIGAKAEVLYFGSDGALELDESELAEARNSGVLRGVSAEKLLVLVGSDAGIALGRTGHKEAGRIGNILIVPRAACDDIVDEMVEGTPFSFTGKLEDGTMLTAIGELSGHYDLTDWLKS